MPPLTALVYINIDRAQEGALLEKITGLIPSSGEIHEQYGGWHLRLQTVDKALFFANAVQELPQRPSVAIHWAAPHEVGLLGLDGISEFLFAGEIGLSAQAAEQASMELIKVRGRRGGGPLFLTQDRAQQVDVSITSRVRDVAAVEEIFGLGVKVVELGGASGVGKTSFALEYAGRIDGMVRIVDLAEASGVREVLCRFAAVLELAVEPNAPLVVLQQAITHGLEACTADLWIVDHIGSDLNSVLRTVFRKTSARWIVVGREPLGVPGVVQYQLEDLPLNDETAALLHRRIRAVSGQPCVVGCDRAILSEVGGSPLRLHIAALGAGLDGGLGLFERLTVGTELLDGVLQILAERDTQHIPLLRLLCAVRAPIMQAALEETFPSEGLLGALRDLTAAGLIEVFGGAVPRVRLVSSFEDLLAERFRCEETDIGPLVAWAARRLAPWTARIAGDPAMVDALQSERQFVDAMIRLVLSNPPLNAARLSILSSLLELRVALIGRMCIADTLLVQLEDALAFVAVCFDVDPMVAVRILSARGEVFARTGDAVRALGDLERAQSLARRCGESGALARIFGVIGQVLAEQRHPDAPEALQRAIDALRSTGQECAANRSCLDFIRMLLAQGDYARADEVIGLVQGRIDPLSAARLSAQTGLLRRRCGELEAAIEAYTAALAFYANRGYHKEEADLRYLLGTALQRVGRSQRAVRQLVLAEELAARSGHTSRRGLILVQLGLASIDRSQLTDAKEQLVHALVACRAGGDRSGQGVAKGFLALLHHIQRDLEQAGVGYRDALRDLEVAGDRRYSALFYSCLGALEAELGNLEQSKMLLSVAELQLPNAERAMRESAQVFHLVLNWAEARAATEEGDKARATALVQGIESRLVELANSETIYLRFGRRYIRSLMEQL